MLDFENGMTVVACTWLGGSRNVGEQPLLVEGSCFGSLLVLSIPKILGLLDQSFCLRDRSYA